MPFRKYTQCYVHTPGDKPFHEKDLATLAIVHGVLPGVFFGALTGLALGVLAGGPIGAIIGLFSGLTVGWANALTQASQQWRYHRLVCLSGLKCAMGTVNARPEVGELGAFDNDEFFDLTLMPHRPGDGYLYAQPSDNYKADKPGIVRGLDAQKALDDHPKNDVFIDDFQGTELVRRTIDDLPFDPITDDKEEYDRPNNRLHCEAEGDFWARIADLATALGALLALLTALTGGAAYGGGAAGAAIGCDIGSIFGPIGCLIGAILGAILGALLAGGVAAAISYAIVTAILQAIFDTDPGEVEDANIGDQALGPISAGDKVAVFGEHVYDGFHEGWHEIHPLMAVIKLADKKIGSESLFYLEWNPDFSDSDPVPDDNIPGIPSAPPDQDITHLSPDDMRQGLNSDKFRRRAIWLRDRWCSMLSEAFSETVRQTQQSLTERWTIHPLVDGCIPRDRDTPPEPIH